MLKIRVIPCLLLRGQGLVKTTKFKDPKYVGDPINAVKIFNDKEVDELVFLDITATVNGHGPNFQVLENIAGEAFMPLGYGGGIRSVEDAAKVFGLGFEKVVINSAAAEDPHLISRLADHFGIQSVVVSIDFKKNLFGKYQVFSRSGLVKVGNDPVEYAVDMESKGAGEILLNSIDRDGTLQGYDIPLIRMVSDAVTIPVIACGGAGNVNDFAAAVHQGHASAVAAGSMFVFHGKHRAVLISYPEQEELARIFD